jgi:hypothetical protein
MTESIGVAHENDMTVDAEMVDHFAGAESARYRQPRQLHHPCQRAVPCPSADEAVKRPLAELEKSWRRRGETVRNIT